MTQRYILDENIVILARKGENDKGESDRTCVSLVEQIIEICHTLVLDPILWDKYQLQLRRLRYVDVQAGLDILRVLWDALQREGKVDLRKANALPFSQEWEIPQGSQDDVPLVRLAVETSATLVTTDGRLASNLNSCGVTEAYGLNVMSPDEALKGLAT